MNTDLRKYQDRAKKYWFIDGLAEIGLGLISIWLAILFSIENLFDQTPIRDLSFFLMAFLGALAVRLLIKRLKEHSTYPRTGYISNKQGKGNKKLILISLAFTAVLLLLQLFMLLNSALPVVAGPLVGGLIFAFIFTMFAYRSLVYQFQFFAILSLLTGGILSLSSINDLIGAAILSAVNGFILIASGGIRRWSYLLNNHLPGGNNGS
jgi:Na+/glutamate symporter